MTTKKANKNITTLKDTVKLALDDYFAQLNGHDTADLYDLVLSQVEPPLLEAVMLVTEGNQTKASEMLGINRGTLRKKLRTYDLN